MPGFNQSGPMGQGPMTGKGFGFCTGGDTPGYDKGFGGRGRGRGRRFGFGMGTSSLRGLGRWGNWSWPFSGFSTPHHWTFSKEDEINILKSQSEALKHTQKEIERRLGELEKKD